MDRWYGPPRAVLNLTRLNHINILIKSFQKSCFTRRLLSNPYLSQRTDLMRTEKITTLFWESELFVSPLEPRLL